MSERALAGDTYYDILGVPRGASASEVAQAYRRLAKQVHPDRGGNDALFRAVDEAYRTLSDPAGRATYDARLSQGPGAGGEEPRTPPPTGARHFYQDEAGRRRREAEAAAARQQRAEKAAAAARAAAQTEAQRVEAERVATVAAAAERARAEAERLAWARTGRLRRYPAGSLTLLGAAASVLGWVLLHPAARPQPDEAVRRYVFAIALAVLVTGLTAGLGWMRLGQGKRQPDAANYQLPDLDSLSGPQFQALLADLFNFMGYRVSAVGGPREHGADLIIENGQHSVAVQANRSRATTGPGVVDEAATARQAYGTCCALVVSTSSFTPYTWQLAEMEDVVLWDRTALLQQLAQLPAATSAPVAPTKYSRPYGTKLLKAELRKGAPVMLKLVLAVPLVLLVILALVAGASGGSTPTSGPRR